MGCGNNSGHQIIPVGLSRECLFQEQIGKSFPTPHMDRVSALTTIHNDSILISGSHDKNLKGWSTFDKFEQKPSYNVAHAHQDHILSLEASQDKTELYSGSKDGIVNIWNVEDGHELKWVTSLQGQGSAITSIASLEP